MRRAAISRILNDAYLPFLYETRSIQSLVKTHRSNSRRHCARWQSTSATSALAGEPGVRLQGNSSGSDRGSEGRDGRETGDEGPVLGETARATTEKRGDGRIRATPGRHPELNARSHESHTSARPPRLDRPPAGNRYQAPRVHGPDLNTHARKQDEEVTILSDDAQPRSFLRQKAQSIPMAVSEVRPKKRPKQSTITREEKLAFRQIFDNIAHGRNVSIPITEVQRGFEEVQSRSPSDSFKLLHITEPDHVIQELYGGSSKRQDDLADKFGVVSDAVMEHIKQYPAALQRMAMRTGASVAERMRPVRPTVMMEEPSPAKARSIEDERRARRVKEICVDVLQEISKAFKKTFESNGTDFALMDICDQTAFAVIRDYTNAMFPTPSQQESHKPLKRVGSEQKSFAKTNQKKIDRIAKLGELAEKHMVGDTISGSEVGQPDQSRPSSKPPRTIHLPGRDVEIPKDIPSMEVFSTLCPAIIVLTLRHLVSRYPSSSLSLSLLPTLHKKGPSAYVLGSSTPFYNTLLAHEWNHYSDLVAMERMLIDMQKGGVSFDMNTLNILDAIREERFFTLSADNFDDDDVPMRDKQMARPAWWWQLDNVKSDFTRITEEWRRTIVESMEGTGIEEEIPDIMYGDELLQGLAQQHVQDEPVVLL